MAGVEKLTCCHNCSTVISCIDLPVEHECGGPYSELWFTWGDPKLFQTWDQALEYWDSGKEETEPFANGGLVKAGTTFLVGEMGLYSERTA